MPFLPMKIQNIFIMLGFGCNFNCRYCLQEGLNKDKENTKNIKQEINPDIYKFINQCANNLNDNEILDIRFYGGEPLLYFDKIKTIVNELKNNKKIVFSIITNGSLLNKEMVDFFNKYKMPVSISWDGTNVEKTRFVDVFKNKKDLIFKLNRLCVSGVLSSYVYPKELLHDISVLDEEYFKIHNHHIMENLDLLLDTNLYDRTLVNNIDFSKVYNDIDELCNKFIYDIEKLSFIERHYIENLIKSVKYFYINNGKDDIHPICSCNNGYSILNIDILGNLYYCHNSHEIAGNIYDDYFKYLNNIIEKDLSIISKKNYCKDCIGDCICDGGCKLIPIEIKKESLCQYKINIIAPIISNLENYGKSL